MDVKIILKIHLQQKQMNIFLQTVCSYHVRHPFINDSALYGCLNVKKLLAPNRHNIWSLSVSNRTWTHNQLFRKQALKHSTKLAKWLSCVVSTYLYSAVDCMFLSCQVQFHCSHLILPQVFQCLQHRHLKAEKISIMHTEVKIAWKSFVNI